VKLIIKIGKVALTFFIGIMLLLGLGYAICPIYQYPPAKAFSGDKLYNPYAQLNGKWFKANFQVQSYCWLGLTNGRNSIEEVVARYKKLGYDIITISDYQRINKLSGLNVNYIPVYEHGYNIWKRHQVCIGARGIIWFDFPLFQWTQQKQFILNLLKKKTDFVAIAHPKLLHAYSAKDMRKLAGYDGIEVLNHFRTSDWLWDAALSAGRAVWILGDDDSHNVDDPNQTGVCWTMINAPSLKEKNILASLRMGRAYGVKGKNALNDNGVKRVDVNNNLITVECDSVASEILFIGQGGKIRKIAYNTNHASYLFTPEDTYIRIKIVSPKTKIYLNPIFRYNGGEIPRPQAEVDQTKTWGMRLCFALGYGAIGCLGVKRILQKRKCC